MVAVVGLVGGVAMVAAALNPPGTRAWLVVCGILAVSTAVHAVTSDPRDLIPALVLALLPVVGLVSKGSPSWLGPILAGLLLVAGELTALVWEGPVRMSQDGSLVARLREAGMLAVVGLGLAALLDGAAGTGPLHGTWAVLAGSLGLAGVGLIVFPPRRASDESGDGAQ